MRFPVDIQPNFADCGATCLRIIGRHYGKTFPINYLREITFTGRNGTSLEGIIKGAEEIGFRTLPVKIEFSKLCKDAKMPVVLHWNQNHFVVAYKIRNNKIFLSDPALGLATYSIDQFKKHWISGNDNHEGIALLLEPTENFWNKNTHNKSEEKLDPRKFLWPYIKPHRRLVFQILMSFLAASLLQLFVPFLTQNIVDTGIQTKNIHFVWLILFAQLALTLGQMSLELLRGWMLMHISKRINITMISDYFIKLMQLPIRYFDTRITGDLMQRISDHSRVETFLTNTSLSVIFSLFTLIIYSIVLLTYDASLFVVFIVGSAIYLSWIFFFLKRRERLDYKRFEQAAQTQSKVFELINGMQEIKLHNAEQQKRWGWERIQVKLFNINVQSLGLEQVQSSGSRIINELKNIVIAVISATLVIEGKLTLGGMLAVSYIIGQLNSPVLQLIGVIKNAQDALISLNRISEIHTKENEGLLNPETVQNHNCVAHQLGLGVSQTFGLSLKSVSFSYDKLSPEVLKDISLYIPPGKVTAIVGTSGSGKSTLLKLLMRFYEPTSGRINFGASEIKNINLTAWRAHCGVVMQEGFVFNDTIAGNIAIGEDSADMNRLIEAARIANILAYVEDLPLGFNTKIGQEGLGISTGQKQRILIARAVYKNPSILFFDEATSSLDANNEREIMENLEKFYVGKTVIVIAHRLSTVRKAEKIVVLENGRIVEEGNHNELTRNRASYYTLVKNQLELGN